MLLPTSWPTSWLVPVLMTLPMSAPAQWQRLRRAAGPMALWLATLLLSLLSATAHAAVDRAAGLSPSGDGFGAALGANTQAWWQPFDDPALARVMQAAGSAPAAQATVMQAYVSWRVAQARGALAGRVQQATLEQQQLLGQPEHAPAEQQARIRELVSALVARGQFWDGVQQQMADECDRAEVQVAAVIRRPRADVQALLSQGSSDGIGIGIGIGNGNGDDANADADDTAAAVSLPQVRANLPPAASQRLVSGNAQALQARMLMEASRLELRAQQLRQQAGAESPLALLEAYQRWVADADRLAALAGNVAMAWAQWLQGGGSVGNSANNSPNSSSNTGAANSADNSAADMVPTSAAATTLPVRGTGPAPHGR